MCCYFFRHAMLVDQSTETVTVPLNAQLSSEGKLELANSASMIYELTEDSFLTLM